MRHECKPHLPHGEPRRLRTSAARRASWVRTSPAPSLRPLCGDIPRAYLAIPLAAGRVEAYILTNINALATHLSHIVATLRAAIGTHVGRLTRPSHAAHIGDRVFIEAARHEPKPPISLDAWGLLWRRLGRLATRFTTLFNRWQSNTLPSKRPGRPRQASPTPAQGSATPPMPVLRLPCAHGWVNHRIPESAPPTGQLGAFLRDREPELREFLTHAPQAARYLRPLCRALGVPQPSWLKLPPRPRRPRPPSASTPRWPRGVRRPATHPFPMLPEDKPFPLWVLRAVRAAKKSGA